MSPTSHQPNLSPVGYWGDWCWPPTFIFVKFSYFTNKKNRYDFAFDLKSYRREKLSKHAVSCFKYTSYFMLLLVFFPEDLDRLSGCHVHLGANTLRSDQNKAIWDGGSMQHCEAVPYKTKDIFEHCKDWKDLLNMIVGRGVRCRAVFSLVQFSSV